MAAEDSTVADGPTVLDRIADYVTGIQYEDLPAEVVEYTKQIFLDSLACLYGGIESEPARITRRVLAGVGGNPQATVISDGSRTSMENAAVCNGVALRYLDYNDIYFGPAWTSHASDNIPTLLAVAEATGASGRDLLLATVLAYEVQMAFSDLPVKRNLWHGGWHHTGACAYSGAAGVAKLLRLDPSQTSHAMALNAARANTFSEIRHGDIPMDKALSAPLAAARGIVSALLAKEGFTGQTHILEGRYGFKHAVAEGVDVTPLIPSRDATFRIMKDGLKPWPVEGMTPAMVEAAIELRPKVLSRLDDITEIVIHVHSEAITKPSWDESKMAPTSKETADHSFPYCVGVALVAGTVTPAHFSEEWLFNPAIRRLLDCSRLQLDDRLTEEFERGGRPARVEIRIDDERYEKEIIQPLGSYARPMSDKQLASKFRSLASPFLDDPASQRVIDRTLALDGEESMIDYVAALVPSVR